MKKGEISSLYSLSRGRKGSLRKFRHATTFSSLPTKGRQPRERKLTNFRIAIRIGRGTEGRGWKKRVGEERASIFGGNRPDPSDNRLRSRVGDPH